MQVLDQEPKSKTLNYPQDKFIFCQDKFVCIKGTWRCGKSMAGLLAANKECEERPNNLYLVLRREYTDLRDSTLRDWMRWVGRPINGDKDVHYANGSTLMFRHGDDLNSLKNTTLGGALMIQAEEMNEDDFWFLKGRLSRKEGTNQLRLDCNYDGHNWIYKLFNIEEIGTLITTNTFDNEANLPLDYIPGLKLLPKRLQERYLYGSDADMEGRVWDEFSLDKNTKDPFYIPSGWDKNVVLDHGFTNPTAVLWAAIDWDGTIFIYDEHYESGKSISYHAEQIKLRDNTEVRRWFIDPSCSAKTQQKKLEAGVVDLHSIIDEYRDYGLRFEPADNALLAGINRVNEFFKSGKLVIFKNCINTIREVENWKWQKIKPGVDKNQSEEPINKDDHTCACLRYLLMSRMSPSEFKTEQELGINSPMAKANELKARREVYVH